MRVSKVKVLNKHQHVMVYVNRTLQNGQLVFEGDRNTDKTDEILPELKRQNFEASILNQVLSKSPKNETQFDKAIRTNLKRLLEEGILPPKQTDSDPYKKEKVISFLKSRFQNEYSYYPSKEAKEAVNFNLTDLIISTIQHQNIQELKPYTDWKEWYIQRKSGDIARSIRNNRIILDQTLNSRQKALEQWGKTFYKDGSLDLGKCETSFKIMDLVVKLQNTHKLLMSQKQQQKIHSELKKTLHEHQKEIFGSREQPNASTRMDICLHTYQQEMVKYLEHYFPVKDSKRKNSNKDIAYYLSCATIKNTLKNQIINALRNRHLQKGKSLLQEYTDKANSDVLTNIKRDYAFALNFLDAVAFAANNLRNIVDKTQEGDILGKNAFECSLGNFIKNTTPEKIQTFKSFFQGLPEDNLQDENLVRNLWALRGSVQQRRNKLLHFHKDRIQDVLCVKTYELPKKLQGDFIHTGYKALLENEIQQLPTYFSRQLETGGIFSYYSIDDLESIFGSNKFSLMRSSVPFTPGFKNIYKQGGNYQNSTKGNNFYDLGLTLFVSTDTFDVPKRLAREFLIRLIYKHLFLPYFTSDTNQFRETVGKVLYINKKNVKTKNKEQWAFEAVRPMGENEVITDYLAYVQSYWMLERQNKEDQAQSDRKLNFEKFLLQVFIVGFDKFMCQNQYTFVNSPNDQKKKVTTKIYGIVPQFINSNQSAHVSFYTFAKLLDAQHLSNLRNEFIKYTKSNKNSVDASCSESMDGRRTEKDLIEMCNAAIEILELCLFSCDQVQTPQPEQYFKDIKPFFANVSVYQECDNLYLKQDGLTPELHTNIELCKKYGTLPILQLLVENEKSSKISKVDFDEWSNVRDKIESLIQEREDKHTAWVKNQVLNRDSSFVQEYRSLIQQIDRYMWLDNKLHFVPLQRIHSLIIEVLGRLVGFVALWERDLQYNDKYHSQLFPDRVLDFSKSNPFAKKDMALISYKNVFLTEKFDKNKRDYIAHFNYLTQGADKSIIDLICDTRALMVYDRKLRNAVSKSIIDIFDRHGMILKLGISHPNPKSGDTQECLFVESVTPKPIYHLGSKKIKASQIKTNQVSEEYANLCKTLLEMKKQR